MEHVKSIEDRVKGAHGSKGRPTLSPGMTHEFNKFHALLLAAKSAA